MMTKTRKDFLLSLGVSILGLVAIGATYYATLTQEISPNGGHHFARAATGASGSFTMNNHTLFQGSAPTLSECGTGATINSWATDNSGTVTVGSGGLTTAGFPGPAQGQQIPQTLCTITFATAFTVPPDVDIVVHHTPTVLGVTRATTAITVRFSADMNAHTFSYFAR